MGAIVVDSSLVIGFFQPEDAHHHRCLAELGAARGRGDEFVLPATVLAESLVGSHRRGPAAVAEKRAGIVGLFGDVRPIDEAVAVVGSELRHRHRSLRLPDALVIATGIVEDATVLTCDRRLAAVDTRVQVLSP